MSDPREVFPVMMDAKDSSVHVDGDFRPIYEEIEAQPLAMTVNPDGSRAGTPVTELPHRPIEPANEPDQSDAPTVESGDLATAMTTAGAQGAVSRA